MIKDNDSLASFIREIRNNGLLLELTNENFTNELISNEKSSVPLDLPNSLMVAISFSNSRFTNVNFRESQIFSSTFSNVHFQNIDFNNVTIWNCEFTHCQFINCNFESASCTETRLEECIFEKNNFSWASFRDSQMPKVTLTDNIYLAATGPFKNSQDFKNYYSRRQNS